MEYTEKQLELLGKFKALWDELGSQSKACERVGISEQIMSSLRSGKYNGDCEKQFKILEEYFSTKEAAKEVYKPVEYAPIGTSNLAYHIIANIRVMGGFGIIVGDPGIGKTKAVQKFASDNPASCIAITSGACIRGTRAVMKQIARSLNIPVSQAIDDLYMSIITKLHDGMVIVVDEAQHLTLSSIEALREISDYFEENGRTCGIVLVGNYGIAEKTTGSKTVKDYHQLNNRRWQMQEMKTTDITMEDIKMVFPLLESDTEALTFLLAVAKSNIGLRGAVKLFTQAHMRNKYDFNGLVETAKIIGMDLSAKAVRR